METALAIIGAGPYGLSLAAHAVAANIPHVLLGEPMAFWRDRMPEDMLVRSLGRTTSLSHPARRFPLPAFLQQRCPAWREGEPYPKQVFLEYTQEFQQQVGVEAEPRWVTRVERAGDRFLVTTGEDTICAKTVALATGLMPFCHVPREIRRALPPSRYTHSSQVQDAAQWTGRRVLVIGGGQSAFEYALLAAQAGSEVVVARRGRRFRFTGVHNPYSRLFMHNLCRSSSLFFSLPHLVQRPLTRWMLPTTLAPWVAAELRCRPVDVLHRATLKTVRETRSGVAVQFQDGRRLEADHLVIATGYRVDLGRLSFLDANLLREIRTRRGAPLLNRHFQSSAPGLFFAGAMAMESFGPAFSFVCGVAKQCRAMIDTHLVESHRRVAVQLSTEDQLPFAPTLPSLAKTGEEAHV